MKCEHEFVTKFGTIECQKCGAEFDEIEIITKFGTFTEYIIKQKQNTMTKEKMDKATGLMSEINFLKRNIENTKSLLNEKTIGVADINFCEEHAGIVMRREIGRQILEIILESDKKQLFVLETKFNDL